MAKDLKEQIEIMTHYLNGGEVEYSEDGFKTVLRTVNKERDGDLSWNWSDYTYRIIQPKQKVTIEKWLCEYVGCEELKGSKRFFIIEKVVPFEVAGKKVKLIKSYEVEL